MCSHVLKFDYIILVYKRTLLGCISNYKFEKKCYIYTNTYIRQTSNATLN